DSFVVLLREAGVLDPELRPACPAQAGPAPTPYAYPLGYRDEEGRLIGLRCNDENRDSLPILSDRPRVLAGAGPASRGLGPDHRTGQNVLYLTGAVRYVNSPWVGVGGDNIYLNNNGLVSAGVNRTDSVLGVDADHP